MSEPTNCCPKCESTFLNRVASWEDEDGTVHYFKEWKCKTRQLEIDGSFHQSDACLIAELRAKLATAERDNATLQQALADSERQVLYLEKAREELRYACDQWRKELAQSSNYTADAPCFPRRVRFNNGRVVLAGVDDQGQPYLDVWLEHVPAALTPAATEPQTPA